MKKTTCLLLLICALFTMLTGTAAVDNQSAKGKIAGMSNVLDFGAKGDGVTKDTAAIQRAIDAGGVVYFPAGTYISGTLYLKSNGGLHLEPGAILKASPDKEDYNADDFCPQNAVFTTEGVSGAHFIVALEQKNIVISGTGIIDGNRQSFYGEKNEKISCGTLNEKFPLEEVKRKWRPGQMLFFCESQNITLRDVKLYNAPYWTCFFHGCEDVSVNGLRILNDQRTRNGDGIDVDCCQRVTISDCIIDSGDDCITLRGVVGRLKTPRPCEQITVTNCVLHTNCNAIRVGVGQGLIRNAVFSNIVIHDSRTAICLVSNYSAKSPGGVAIENISFDNFRVDCDRVFDIRTFGKDPAGRTPAKDIKNIRFRNFTGSFTQASRVAGYRNKGMKDISFDDFRLECTGTFAKLRDNYKAGYGDKKIGFPAAAFFIADASGVEFSRVRILWNRHTAWKHGIAAVRARNLKIENCDLGRENAVIK